MTEGVAGRAGLEAVAGARPQSHDCKATLGGEREVALRPLTSLTQAPAQPTWSSLLGSLLDCPLSTPLTPLLGAHSLGLSPRSAMIWLCELRQVTQLLQASGTHL